MRILAALGILAIALSPIASHAQTLCDPAFEQRLLPSDRIGTYEFGHEVAVADGVAVVGMPGQWSRDGVRAGAASIFEIDAAGVWREAAKVTAPFGRAHGEFGWAVATTGRHVFVTQKDGGPSGSHVYVYRRSSSGEWRLSAELAPADRDSQDNFGWALATSGDSLFVGAPEEYPRKGFVCVFQLINGAWTEVTRIVPPTRGVHQFGRRVAVHGDTAAVTAGDPRWRERDTLQTVHILERQPDDSWLWLWEFSGEVLNGGFGDSLAVQPNRIFVGAPLHEGWGLVYVIERTEGSKWTETAYIKRDRRDGDHFGTVAAVGNRLFIGAPGTVRQSEPRGVVYLYEQNDTGSWVSTNELVPDIHRPLTQFGRSLAVADGTLIAGAPTDVDNIGAAYTFDIGCSISLVTLGECPGNTRLDCTDCTPFGRVAFLHAPATGRTDLPFGTVCAGTSLDLDHRLQIGRIVDADEYGLATGFIDVPAPRCGRLVVQALDIETCTTSGVVAIR